MCVCARACVRVCLHVCVRARLCVCVKMGVEVEVNTTITCFD